MPSGVPVTKTTDKLSKDNIHSSQGSKSKRIQLPIKLASIIKNSAQLDSERDLSQAVRNIENIKQRELSSYLRVVCMRTGLTA
jgi:hypothetical protein